MTESIIRSHHTEMQPDLDEVWGFAKPFFLVRATPNFIVWIDEDLDVDWKTKNEWDAANGDDRSRRIAILSRGSAIESADWDRYDPQKTLQFKRHIAEAYAASFESDFANAEILLEKAEEYRVNTLKFVRRQQAIKDQVQTRNDWKKCHRRWVIFHYTVGCGALFGSTLIAARGAEFGLTNSITAALAWLVAFLTGLLTFLTPDKKADKYARAWATLSTAITRYNVDENYSVSDVIDASQRGQNIIFEHPEASPRKRSN